MLPISPPSRSFESLWVDELGPFKITDRGHHFILVFNDYLTKWLVAVQLPGTAALSVIKALVEEIVPRHGMVYRIISNQGPAFISEAVEKSL